MVLGPDVTEYEVLAAREGASDRFVARFVDATGGIAKSRVTVAKGAGSREKLVAVTGECDAAALIGRP